MTAWAGKFAKYHPAARVRLRDDTRLTTDAMNVAIASDEIDLIPSARELVPSESVRLTQKLGGEPLAAVGQPPAVVVEAGRVRQQHR